MLCWHLKYWAVAPVLDIHNADILSHTVSPNYRLCANARTPRIETRAATALVFRVKAFGRGGGGEYQ